MAKPVDLELKQAFIELQAKMTESSRKIQLIDNQMQVINKVVHHIDVTQREIGALPTNTRTYEAIGRLFLLTDLEEVKARLVNRKTQLASKASDLACNKGYLENNLKESEDNLREMIQQRKEVKP